MENDNDPKEDSTFIGSSSGAEEKKSRRHWTLEMAREELEKFGYRLESKVFKRMDEKLDMICTKGHKCSISMNKFMNNRRCKHCVRERVKTTNLEKYGTACALQNPIVQAKSKDTLVQKYGVDNPMKNLNIQKRAKEKRTTTNMEKYGVECILQNPEIREKIKTTVIEKYGVDHPMKNLEIQEKKYTTNINRYGHISPLKNVEIQQKIKNTIMEKYGVKNPMQNLEIHAKQKITLMKNYGVENPGQNPEIKAKIRATMKELYGVEYPIQNPEIYAKFLASSFKKKTYTFPSGRTAICQGYEPFCLDYLLEEGYHEDDIIVGDPEHIPIIDYIHVEGRASRYFPDIYLPPYNRIIEVKSDYIYYKEEENNIRKFEATAKAGYDLYLYIFDAKGEVIDEQRY